MDTSVILDAENSLAGSILIDGQAVYERVADLVGEGDFLSQPCRTVFVAARSLFADNKPIDPVLVLKWCEEHGEPLKRETVLQLMEVTPTTANAERHAELVRQGAKRRKLRELGQRLAEDNATPAEELAGLASIEIEEIFRQEVGNRCLTSTDQMRILFDGITARERGERNTVSSGYPNLDRQLGGGFLRGGLYIIAARPGMGKTTLALNIADNISGGVMFVSLEMPPEQLAAKRVARISKVPANRILTGANLTENEMERIAIASSGISQSGVVVNRKMGATVSEVATLAHTVKNLSAVVVDYIGLISPSDRRLSAYERTCEISGALKRLAMSLNVPVIALSQLNRAVEGREDKQPRLSDLRDSGSVEQDADAVLLLFRPDYYEGETSGSVGVGSIIQCEVAKNRHAGTGKVYFESFLAESRVEVAE